MKRSLFFLLAIIAALSLAACGGGSAAPPSGSNSDYTIGGTVNGLSGTVLLQNNGRDDLTITTDGVFTFSKAFADGSTYSVTVKTQPDGQTCTVTNSSGTISGVDVTDVSVNCANKAWTNPSSLMDNISPDGQFARYPQVAMDHNGHAVIVWQQSDGSNKQIFKSEYRNGTWTNPSSVTNNISPNGTNADSPQVAMDNNGHAVIVWRQYDGSHYQIFRSEYRNGTWTNPASLNDNISPNGTDADNPQVAMDDNGHAVIVWRQYDGSNYQIFKSEYRSKKWTNPVSLTDNISPDGDMHNDPQVDNPQVAMDNNGHAVIVWYQYDGSGYDQIFRSEYRNGKWTNPASLNDNISPNGVDADSPQVAMDDNGNAVIVWYQNTSNGHDQIFRSEYRNGTWTKPSSLTGNIPNGVDASSPQVVMDDNGNAIIVWDQYDGSKDQIFRSEYRNGTWTNPSSVNDNISPNGQDAWYPQVAMDDNGNAVIVWQQYDGSNWQIFKSEYRNKKWTNPALLADNISPNGQYAWYPQVAMDDNGNAVIAWYQYDSTGYTQIFKSEYR